MTNSRAPTIVESDDSDNEYWREEYQWEMIPDSPPTSPSVDSAASSPQARVGASLEPANGRYDLRPRNTRPPSDGPSLTVVNRKPAPSTRKAAHPAQPRPSARSDHSHIRRLFRSSSPVETRTPIVITDEEGDAIGNDTYTEAPSTPPMRQQSIKGLPLPLPASSLFGDRVEIPTSSKVKTAGTTATPSNKSTRAVNSAVSRHAAAPPGGTSNRVLRLPPPPADSQIGLKPSTQAVVPIEPSLDATAAPPPGLAREFIPIKLAEPIDEKFLDDRLGQELQVEIIAHDQQVQAAMDDKKISWGVQWELSRGVTLGVWKWSDVLPKLDKLRGDNTLAAHKVISAMKAIHLQADNMNLWQELDREQAAIIENKGRGLGLMGPWHGVPDWYGGQIQQLARIAKDGNSYKIQLQSMEKRRSHRFARFLGSRRVIQLRVPDDLVNGENEKVRKYLEKKFILCGRVFVPFHSKEGSAYLMETNQDYERSLAEWAGDQHRISFAEFINWHNPLLLNQKQPISKWSTRFAIGLSNSSPALEFKPENISIIDDLYSTDYVPGTKASAEVTTTDGCGFINRAALMEITKRFTYQSMPTAIQGRVMNAKGLWVLHPYDDYDEPRIWVRDSQNKIKLSYLDRTHRILDLLAPSLYSSSAPLTEQSILNLDFNGIPHTLLTNLLERGLRSEVEPLMEWDQPNAMIHLWNAINQLGRVTSARGQRLAASLGRALGLAARDWGREAVELVNANNPGAIEDVWSTSAPTRDEHSGAPLGPHESCLEYIQAGFRPQEVQPLRNKIRKLIEITIDTAVEKFRIPIGKSLGAFVIPDPIGVLKEGEIFYRSSQPIKDEDTQTFFNVVVGEVVIGRYPIRLSSDMQRVVAVDEPSLYNWPDVIIVPTVGKVSFASLLSGGDYDGDEPFIIWEHDIVQYFKNRELIKPPPDLKTFFESEVETVTEFRQRVQKYKPGESQRAFQHVLLLGLFDAKVGMYSNFHETAIAKFGYNHEETIMMAYIFATLLDSSKTGLRLKKGVFELHSRKFGSKSSSSQRPNILDSLRVAGKGVLGVMLATFDKAHPEPNKSRRDDDLRRPYDKFKASATKARINGYNQLEEDLKLIENHTVNAKEEWCKAVGASKGKEESPFDLPAGKGKKPKKSRNDPFAKAGRLYAQPVAGIAVADAFNVEEIKASYAHILSPTFGYSVAFRELCTIKAKASPGGIAPTLRVFDEAKGLSNHIMKALNKVDLERL